MNLIDKVKALFAEVNKSDMAETVFVKTEDGKIFLIKAATPAVDAEIVMIDEAGVEQAIEDGDYVLEDKSTVSVKGGLIAAITEAPVEEEVIAEATPVEEEVAAEVITEPTLAAGNYELENGDIITVDENGVVVLVTKAEPSVEEEMSVVVDTTELDAAKAELETVKAELEAVKMSLENKEKEVTVAKEAFEKLKSAPAAKAIDTKKFEKTETAKATESLLSKVSEILNKK